MSLTALASVLTLLESGGISLTGKLPDTVIGIAAERHASHERSPVGAAAERGSMPRTARARKNVRRFSVTRNCDFVQSH
jgi:hypothetical protein